MRNSKITIVKAFCATLAGCFLVTHPYDTTKLLVMLAGLIFFVYGSVSVVKALSRSGGAAEGGKAEKPFPVSGIGSGILGLLLMLAPAVFISGTMYILGILLVAGGVWQIAEFRSAAKIAPVSLWLYVSPALAAAAGVFVLFNPAASASLPFLILGAGGIVYGISEMLKYFRIKKANALLSRRLGGKKAHSDGFVSSESEGDASGRDAG